MVSQYTLQPFNRLDFDSRTKNRSDRLSSERPSLKVRCIDASWEMRVQLPVGAFNDKFHLGSAGDRTSETLPSLPLMVNTKQYASRVRQ
jgi:hypothetical protein